MDTAPSLTLSFPANRSTRFSLLLLPSLGRTAYDHPPRTILAEPAFVALSKFAQAYLPSASLVLAGSLVSGARAGKQEAKDGSEVAAVAKEEEEEEEEEAGGMKRFVATLCVVRFLLMPLLSITLLRSLEAAKLFPAVSAAPVLWFFLLTEFAMPPAQNSVLIFQVRRSRSSSTSNPDQIDSRNGQLLTRPSSSSSSLSSQFSPTCCLLLGGGSPRRRSSNGQNAAPDVRHRFSSPFHPLCSIQNHHGALGSIWPPGRQAFVVGRPMYETKKKNGSSTNQQQTTQHTWR